MDEALLSKTVGQPWRSFKKENILLNVDVRNHDISLESHEAPPILSSSSPLPPTIFPLPSWNPPITPSVANLLTNLNRRKTIPRRSYSAPSLVVDSKEDSIGSVGQRPPLRKAPTIVKLASVGVIVYIAIGVAVYAAKCDDFSGHKTFRLVDALYFSVVTLCTIGYGDIVPNSDITKMFTCFFILVGFGFIDILLTGLVTYVLDRQEAVLLSTMDADRHNAILSTYIMDMTKGRMRIRIKVGLALMVVIFCIAIGMIMIHVLEGLDWMNSFYLSVTSVTTVGFGDYAFKTLVGRLFAIFWLLLSTLAVARAFLYLTELRIDKRNRMIAKWVLQRKMTLGDLVAADLDHDGSISKSEYVIYKLKEMGKIEEKDIMLICNQFNRLDTGNCGKITLSDLMEGHH